jgi:hypothetical protein
MCFLAMILNATQGHSSQNDAKEHNLTRKTKNRTAATYGYLLVFGFHLLGYFH